MLSEVIEVNGTKKLRPLAGNYINNDEKIPVGVITAYWGTTPPENWLVCNGATFDTAAYPELYALLGGNRLPDLRESTLVGAGERTSGVTTHDVYSIGQFKDDQVGVHTHSYRDAWGNETNGFLGYSDNTQVDVRKALTSSPIQHSSWRWGINHGWVYGVLTTDVGTIKSFTTWGGTTRDADISASWDFMRNDNVWQAGLATSGGGGGVTWQRGAVSGTGYGKYTSGGNRSVMQSGNGWGAEIQYGFGFRGNHSHGIPSLYNDHRHIMPYIGPNTDAGNPDGRLHESGERNGNVTRTKQTGVAFIIKAK